MFYLIIATLLTLPHETTTKFEYFNWPLTFENEKIQDLNRKGNLIEKVWYGNVHAYSKRKVNNKSFEEYYRINDTLFHYKKVVDSSIVDKGYFKINKKEIFTSDTIYIACRYGEWEDIIQIHHFHQPVKIEYWRSNPSKSETIKGRYIDGRKHGVWMHRKGERDVKINYQMDDTLGIYNPTFRQVMNNFKWLSNKEFHICSKFLFQFEVLSTNMLQTYPCMSNEFHEICEDNLTFKFISNSMVNIKHSIVEAKNAEDLSGIYKYSIDQELNLIIDLNENGIISRKIKYFGKDAIK